MLGNKPTTQAIIDDENVAAAPVSCSFKVNDFSKA